MIDLNKEKEVLFAYLPLEGIFTKFYIRRTNEADPTPMIGDNEIYEAVSEDCKHTFKITKSDLDFCNENACRINSVIISRLPDKVFEAVNKGKFKPRNLETFKKTVPYIAEEGKADETRIAHINKLLENAGCKLRYGEKFNLNYSSSFLGNNVTVAGFNEVWNTVIFAIKMPHSWGNGYYTYNEVEVDKLNRYRCYEDIVKQREKENKIR